MLRILVLTAALVLLSALASPGAFAQGKVNCSYDVCVAGCSKNGGQPRFCGDYCTKQISSRKAEGKCK